MFSKAINYMIGLSTISGETFSGYKIMIVDCTNFSKVGKSGVAGRIHYCISMFQLAVEQAIVSTNKKGETFKNFAINEFEIFIGDRIYCNAPGILYVKKYGAEVIVRYNFGAMPVYKNKKAKTPIDVLAWARKGNKSVKLISCTVLTRDRTGAVLKGRLIAIKLPDDKAREAQQRVKLEYKKATTKTHLERARYVIVFTTVPCEKISNVEVMKLYRLRWQVELQIKRDKSIAEIDFMKLKKEEGVKSWLLGHLLAQEIAKRIGRGNYQQSKEMEIEFENTENETKTRIEQKEAWLIFQLGWFLLKRAIFSIETKKVEDIVEEVREEIEKTGRHNRPRALEIFRPRLLRKSRRRIVSK